MTGIERLADIVNDGPYSGGMIHISVQKLREICEQIEREVADISGHESDVLAFVEEKGGLDELERRLMPEGMEWPRFEDGELVGFGDEYVNANGNVSTLRTIMINDCRDRLGGGYYWKLGKGACAVVVKNGERIKRPPVLAADGKPLLDGDEVWKVKDGGGPYHVQEVRDGVSVCVGETHREFRPDQLTHQRPVLDADGVPIKKGDTVWHKATGEKYRVFRFSDEENRVWGETNLGSFFLDCSMLTHTKPEPPDNAERIADDIMRMVDEWCSYPTLREASEKAASSVGEATMGLALRSLSKRCRAIAEREMGE